MSKPSYRAVSAAAQVLYFTDPLISPANLDRLALALEAAAPILVAQAVEEARANNDHLIEGGEGYSSGFHYALHCIASEEEA